VKRLTMALLALVVLAGAAGIVSGLPGLARERAAIPTTQPSNAPLDVRVQTRGEISARTSVSLSAPPIGGTLQIVSLAPSGSLVKKGDVVVRFDRAEQDFAREQAASDLEEAEQELVKLESDSKVQAANDGVALLKARFAVRRAELEVAGNEFVGTIKARQNLLTLEQERRHLAQLQEDAKAHADTGVAARAVLAEKREKARLAMQFADRNIASLEVTAPIDGLVIVKENQNASGGIYFTGMSLPEFHEGDSAQPGATIADVVDVSTLEMKAKVGETDRESLAGATAAQVRFDGLGPAAVPAKPAGVGGLANTSFWEVTSERQFDATFGLQSDATARLRPGMTAAVEVEANRVQGALHLPRQALFEKNGTTVVYVRGADGFVARPVKVVRVTESRAVLEGLDREMEVALTDPDRAVSAPTPAALPTQGGPR
jgi:multidrug resistance efflux pump